MHEGFRQFLFHEKSLKTYLFQEPIKTIMINLILRNSSNSFQSSCAIKSALSDFHKMFVTDMKMKFEKLKDSLIP